MSLPADDLLSAFHDGTISASEQATVERRLTLASAARQELSEIRQVSALLKGLPRESLPPEFPQLVLAAIEREMLVPSRRADREGDATGRQRWVIGGAAVLTSAAGLLLMLNVFNHGSTAGPQLAARSGRGFESRLVRTELAASEPAGDTLRHNEFTDRPLAILPSTARELDGDSVKIPSAPLGLNRNSALAGASGLNRVEANLAESESQNSRVARTSEFFFDRSAFQSAQIGEVVEALRTEGDQVAVVRLTVIDRQEGLKELQLLLANSQIEVAEPSDEAEKLSGSVLSKKGADKADRSQDAALAESLPAAPDQLLAVFVESDVDQLTAALQQLRETKNLESLEVESPILVAQLDDVGIAPPTSVADKTDAKSRDNRSSAKEIKEQIALIDALTQAKKSMSPRRGISPENAARKKPASSKLSNIPAEAAPQEPQSGDKAKAAASSARQYALQVPVQSLPQLEQAPTSRTQSFGTARAKQSAPARQSGAVSNGAATKSTRPMQVLFVVVDQAQTSQSPAATPKAKAPIKARTTPAKPGSPDGAA